METKQANRQVTKPNVAERAFLDLITLRASSVEKGLPELAFGINSMRFHAVRNDPQFTMACDARWNVYINFEHFMGDTESVATAASALLHELYHLLYNHFERDQFSREDSELLNISQDLEINSQLFGHQRRVRIGRRDHSFEFPRPLEGRICMPGESFFAGLPKDRTYEFYYQELRKKRQGNGDGRGGDMPDSDCSGVGKGDGTDDGDVLGRGSAKDQGYSPIQVDAIKQKIAQDIKEHAGNLPPGYGSGEWEVWADVVLGKPTVKLDRVLKQYGSSAQQHKQATARRTYRRPNRRPGLDSSIIRPTRQAQKVIMALLPDTSGSMGGTEGKMVKTEVKSMMSRPDVEVNVLPFDGAVVNVQKDVRKYEEIKWQGGGGTDIRVPLNYLREHHDELKTDYVVALTDGGTPWPGASEVFSFPVLLVIPRHCERYAPREDRLPQGFKVVIADLNG